MNDFDWAFEEPPPRSTDVRRRLMLDRRNYDVTAFDGGEGTVGLRVTGWDAGYVVTELVGELPAADAFDVGNLIASALTGFRGGSVDRDPDYSDAPSHSWWPTNRSTASTSWWAARRAAAPNSGKPWAPHDLDLLVSRFREGASIKALTSELGRTDGAIRQRLQLLGESRASPTDEEPADEADGEPAEED